MRTEPQRPAEQPASETATDLSSVRHSARQAWLRIEWGLLLLATLVAAMLLAHGALNVPDRIVYDHLMPTLERPAPDDIVVVTIDDKSIEALGRWPWKRGIHAQLVNAINNGAPRAIGLDLLLTESDNSGGDQTLANALLRRRNTVLPLLTTPTDTGSAPRLPVASLASAVGGIGHIRLNLGSDGRVRSVALTDQVGERAWPSFALALHQLGMPSAAPLSAKPAHSPFLIPLFGPAGHFAHVSYIDVLQGTVPAPFFRDKTVLVGAVGAGLGDLFPTPLGLMSGVEVHANILGALQEGRSIALASSQTLGAFAALPAVLALLGFTFLSPRGALVLTGVLTAGVVIITTVLFREGLWLPPSAALLLLWLVYPLWSWRRLEAALRYLSEETNRLADAVPLSPQPGKVRQVRGRWEFLERRIEGARSATRRMLDLHRFATDNLASMPEANLLINLEGRLVLFNRNAQDLFAVAGQRIERGQDIAILIGAIATTEATRCWPALLLVGNAESCIEMTDSLGRIFSVRGTPSHNARGEPIGWIITLSDLTALRTAEHQRDQGLNFISHDIRAPQTAILAALSLYRRDRNTMDEAALFARIEKSVRSTLSLADEFVLLARARSGAPHQEELDMDSLMADAADELWALARDKQVQITIDNDAQSHWVRGERQMLVRALANLLSNAIKYGPGDGHVTCRLSREDNLTPEIVCRIDDEGPGLPPSALAKLFTPFFRTAGNNQSGAGLGLHFVQTVVNSHGGRVAAENIPGGGTRFILRLPAAPEENH